MNNIDFLLKSYLFTLWGDARKTSTKATSFENFMETLFIIKKLEKGDFFKKKDISISIFIVIKSL